MDKPSPPSSLHQGRVWNLSLAEQQVLRRQQENALYQNRVIWLIGPLLGGSLGWCLAWLWWDQIYGSILDTWTTDHRPDYSALVFFCVVFGLVLGIILAQFPRSIWILAIAVAALVSLVHWSGPSWTRCICATEFDPGGYEIDPWRVQLTRSSLPGLVAGVMTVFAGLVFRLLGGRTKPTHTNG